MIFNDLEKFYSEMGIENKYVLTLLVSQRARQISEQKGNIASEGGGEKFICAAIRDIEEKHVTYTCPPAEPKPLLHASEHVVVED